MATLAEQAVIAAARTLVTTENIDGEIAALAVAVEALDAEQAPQPPYAVGDTCSYLDHHHWLLAKVEAIAPSPDLADRWVVDLCVRAPRNQEHRMTKTVDAKGVGENVAPLRDH